MRKLYILFTKIPVKTLNKHKNKSPYKRYLFRFTWLELNYVFKLQNLKCKII